MTKARKMRRAGPTSTAISMVLRRSRRGRRRAPGDVATTRPAAGDGVPPPAATSSASTRPSTGELVRTLMMVSASALLDRVVDGVDDALGRALAGEQVDHADVQRVADVLAEERVEPHRDVGG